MAASVAAVHLRPGHVAHLDREVHQRPGSRATSVASSRRRSSRYRRTRCRTQRPSVTRWCRAAGPPMGGRPAAEDEQRPASHAARPSRPAPAAPPTSESASSRRLPSTTVPSTTACSRQRVGAHVVRRAQAAAVPAEDPPVPAVGTHRAEHLTADLPHPGRELARRPPPPARRPRCRRRRPPPSRGAGRRPRPGRSRPVLDRRTGSVGRSTRAVHGLRGSAPRRHHHHGVLGVEARRSRGRAPAGRRAR